MSNILPVIMVGGSGTRLWPLSRQSRPKQFHALLGERTLLQATVERVSGSSDGIVFEAPLLIAGRQHEQVVRDQLRPEQIGGLVLEPVGRNTAPCAVVAAKLAARLDPAQLILLLPSDHHIADVASFRSAVAAAAPAAAAGRLVTFGIRPSRPETGYGYILGEGREDLGPVLRFVEKPDADTAAAYLADGRYLWNAGIFLLRADLLLDEMGRFRPDILSRAAAALDRADTASGVFALEPESFAACPADSIDYAVMEQTESASVMPMEVGWSDVGDFDALWGASEKDDDGNVVRGEAILRNSVDNLVITDGQLVTLVGVSDLVVVVQDGVVLVLPRSRAQDVKGLTGEIRQLGRPELL